MRNDDYFELPKNEVMLLDRVKGFYYVKDLTGLLKYVRELVKETGFEYKEK